ncbi:MAG TPA: hypothetical protein VFS00_09260 [Polyangiaceae bacterium]|nr:hypothetical protein [Polyangiaceae bacterium]
MALHEVFVGQIKKAFVLGFFGRGAGRGRVELGQCDAQAEGLAFGVTGGLGRRVGRRAFGRERGGGCFRREGGKGGRELGSRLLGRGRELGGRLRRGERELGSRLLGRGRQLANRLLARGR